MRNALLKAGAVLSLSALPCAGADEVTVLTLSCDGEVKHIHYTDDKPARVTKMGVLVNLPERSVIGFAHPARITKIDAVSVEFSGDDKSWSIEGSVDRITGSIAATERVINASWKIVWGQSWNMTCIPTKRVF